MALTKCKECGGEVSTKASACPKCGAPIKAKKRGCSLGCGGLVVLLIGGCIVASSINSAVNASNQRKQEEEQQRQAEAQAQAIQSAKATAKQTFEKEAETHYLKLIELAAADPPTGAVPLLDRFHEYGLNGYKHVADLNSQVRTKLAEQKLKELPADDVAGRLAAYKTLSTFHPDLPDYAEQVKVLQAKFDEQEAKRRREAQAEAEKQAKAAARKKQIESQFSPWSGAHRGLEDFIQKHMKNPDSYKHVETVYGDKGDYLIVKTTYRGTNSFNAVVTNWIEAKVDLDGSVLEIIAQGP